MARILVVEDEVVIAMLLTSILEELGHQVIGVEATEDGAVASALRESPDILLIDERLREGSGCAAMQRILREGFVRHIFMSGAPVRSGGMAPGIAALHKPFNDRELETAIAHVLSATGIGLPRAGGARSV